MRRDIRYLRLVLAIRPPDHPGAGRRTRFRESMDTLLLGVPSSSIGVVLLIALAAGIAGRPIPGWNVKAIGSSASYHVPSQDCAIGALVGDCLGLAGILLARFRHRTISLLPILGTALSVLHILRFFLFFSVKELL
jgi:hypothetical protein